MSYMNDDTDPFGMPYTPYEDTIQREHIKKQKKNLIKNRECIVFDKEENKYQVSDKGCLYPIYCGVKNNDIFENITECCVELNRLKNENEQLKKGYVVAKDNINELRRLQLANKQLKKELSDFKQIVYGFEDIIDLKNWQQKYENR